MQIDGSVVFVTGANRGIGRALVDAFLAHGASKVYAAARRADTLAELGGDARVVPVLVDILDAAQIDAAAQAAGDVTVLVNNAGSLAFTDPLEGDLAAIEAEWRTNYLGTLAVSRAFAPVLERNGGGAIVNLHTLLVYAPVPGMAGYSAAKAAAASTTIALRARLTAKNITVHGVYPGPVDTDMMRGMPIPKASPSDVAEAIVVGVESGQTIIHPDPWSQESYKVWRDDPAALEAQMASMG
jgi:NAD(P)-dependent dehydrogenase (short-subunit alcohol dehydrogenase family)